MSEESKAVLKRFFDDILNGGKLEVLDEIVSPDFFNHSTAMGVTPDREGWRTSLGMLLAGYSDLHYEVSDLMGEGEMAALRFDTTGIHVGNLFGVEPTGKKVDWSGMFICRVVDGKMVERWELRTDLKTMQQLGVIPS
ncbi:MAG: putative ester cyclase [Chloroflexi bacterium]|jgi:predicted ester cyclase|nr:MAG: putative ester cyclase [Chloroflexota bacterium]